MFNFFLLIYLATKGSDWFIQTKESDWFIEKKRVRLIHPKKKGQIVFLCQSSYWFAKMATSFTMHIFLVLSIVCGISHTAHMLALLLRRWREERNVGWNSDVSCPFLIYVGRKSRLDSFLACQNGILSPSFTFAVSLLVFVPWH